MQEKTRREEKNKNKGGRKRRSSRGRLEQKEQQNTRQKERKVENIGRRMRMSTQEGRKRSLTMSGSWMSVV